MDETINELRKIRKAVDKEYNGRFADYVQKLIVEQNKFKTPSSKKRVKRSPELAR